MKMCKNNNNKNITRDTWFLKILNLFLSRQAIHDVTSLSFFTHFNYNFYLVFHGWKCNRLLYQIMQIPLGETFTRVSLFLNTAITKGMPITFTSLNPEESNLKTQITSKYNFKKTSRWESGSIRSSVPSGLTYDASKQSGPLDKVM